MKDAPATLDRAIGRWDLVGLTINLVVGAGIFGLPSKLFAIAGPWSVVAVIACAVLMALVVLCFAEVASRFERTGGPYLYARETFGDVVGFGTGWLMWLRSLTSFGAICNLLLTYLGALWPAVATGGGRIAVATGVTVVVAAIVVRGVRGSATFCNALTIGKLIPLLAFVGVGVFFVRPERLALGPWPGAETFSSAVLPLVFAFAGFDSMVVTSGEMRRPRNDVAFGLFVSVAAVAVLYMMIQAVCVGTLPGLATSERPLAEAAGNFLGPAAARFIVLGAVVSTFGAIFATVLTGPRVVFALAEQGQFPRWLAATHPRFRTPHVAILVSAAGMLAVTLTGSFVYAVTINAMIRLITYTMTCLALLVLRRRAGQSAPGFKVPGAAFVAPAAIVLCLWVLTRSTAREARDLAIAAAVGLVLYLVSRLRLRGPP